MTCEYCAGTGKVTTHIRTVTREGVQLSPTIHTVKDCPKCKGEGLEYRATRDPA